MPIGDLTRLQKASKLCLRYVLELEEWQGLVESCRSYPQIKSVWQRIRRIEARLNDTQLGDALLWAFGRYGRLKEALDVFKSMRNKTSSSWLLVLSMVPLSRCFEADLSCRECLEDAKNLFDSRPKTQESWNLLLAVYAQNGHLDEAKNLFDQIQMRDVVSWNSMIAAAAITWNIDGSEEVFRRMPTWDSVSWDAMHAAYAQQGHFSKTVAFFDRMPLKGVLAWNIMLSVSCDRNGLKEAINYFRLMKLEGLEPDEFSFTCILIGSKLRVSARRCFASMVRDHGIKPTRLHYECVKDLMDRTGAKKGVVSKRSNRIHKDKRKFQRSSKQAHS